MIPQFTDASRTAALAAWACLLCAGCTGSADIHLVSLDAQEIDPPAAEVLEYDARQAYWHVDECGELVISIRARKPNLFFPTDVLISLVPGAPPAGSGRNYHLRYREARIAVICGGTTQRLRTYRGVMTVGVQDEDTLTGSFRAFVRSDAQLKLLSLLPPRRGDFLCFGTFRAVRDATRARRLRAEAESLCGTRGRPRPPTSAPGPSTTAPSTHK